MWNSVINDLNIKKNIENKIFEINNVLLENLPSEQDFSLIGHFGGHILFNSYYTLLNKNISKNEYVESQINKKNIQINNIKSLKYSNGLFGYLYLAEYLNKEKFIKFKKEYFSVDLDLFDKLILDDKLDFLHGSVGFVNYLTAIDSNKANVLIFKWINFIKSRGYQKNDKIEWKVKYGLNDNDYGLCFGLSHGVPAILLVLLKIASKFNDKATEKLLSTVINGMMEYLSFADKSFFPLFETRNEGLIRNDRIGWCYGDVSCAYSIMLVGIFLNNEEFIKISKTILLHYCKMSNELTSKIIDPDFCHGTIGIAHIYSRVYNIMHEDIYKETAQFWYNQTLSKSNFANGVAGFMHYDSFSNSYKPNLSLLEGISGIGLSFISSISNIEPRWDKCLLLS